METVFDRLSQETVHKILTAISEDSGHEKYVCRIPYSPNANVRTHIWMVVETHLSLEGIAWDSKEVWVPSETIEYDPGKPDFLESVPEINLEWSDLSKPVQSAILKMGRQG